MKAGKCGVSELGGFPLEDLKILIAAQIKNFDPKARLKHFVRDKLVMHADRYSWFAAAAADEAVKQSGLKIPVADPYRSACIVGSGAGGLVTFENSYRALFIEGKRATHPLTLLRIIGSSASAHVGIEFGVKGPTFATCSACSTATHAIGIARDYIKQQRRRRRHRRRVGIGHQLRHHEGLAGAARAVARRLLPVRQEAQRHRARRRRGHPRHGIARARQGARRQDPGRDRRLRHVVRRQGHGQPRHRGPERGHALALEDAKLSPSDIHYLNAHGTATTINDANETNAIKEVFGNHAKNLAISSTKSMHGHPLGAGGGIEAVACIKAMNESWVPPTIGLDEPDPECDLDYVPNVGRDKNVTYAMSNSFAFGGLNAVLVFGPPPA